MTVRNLVIAMTAVILPAFMLSSCGKENEIDNKQKDGGGSTLSFSIAIPKGDPVTYATHDADEWGIESLWLYEYDDAGKLLAAPVDIKSSLIGAGPEYKYERAITPSDIGVRKFRFVANEAPDASIVVGTTIAQLEALLAKNNLISSASYLSANLLNDFAGKKRIPMTGLALQSGSDRVALTNAGASVSVEMTRIVARIDIANRVPNLLISAVKLSKTNTHSHLFLKGDYLVPAGNVKKNDIRPFAALPTPAFDFDKHMAKAFYLYEGHQPSMAEAVRIEITGTLGGIPVFYSIPFWKNGQEVPVKRNHIYRLTLGDGQTPIEPGTELTFTIEDKPWNEVTMNEILSIISATYTSAGGTYNPQTRTLSLNNATHGESFELSTKFQGHSSFTATILGGATWLTASTDISNLTLNVSANTTGATREAVIQIHSNVDFATKYAIKIQQAG